MWTAATGETVFRNDQAQLVLYPPLSITRFMALSALERAGAPWRIACTSADLSGLTMATGIGLGMMAHSSTLIPRGLRACESDPRLPEIGAIEFVILEKKTSDPKLRAEMSRAIRARVGEDASRQAQT